MHHYPSLTKDMQQACVCENTKYHLSFIHLERVIFLIRGALCN